MSVTLTAGTPTPTIGSVVDRSMLVDQTISMWTARKADKKITAEVAQRHGTDSTAGVYLKNLVAKEALEELSKLRVEWAAEHRRRTLPWLDGGQRILSSAGYFEYQAMTARFQARWDELVDKFVAAYPEHYNDARRRLNGLFNSADYPNPTRIRERFQASVKFFPMPTSADFRVQLGEVETARVRAEIEATTTAALREAMVDAWKRVRDVCQKMTERLSTYVVTPDGAKGIFRDSLVENVRDLVEILPSLNVTNDVDLSMFTKRMRDELCKYDAQTLRESPIARQEVASAADKILKQVSDFL